MKLNDENDNKTDELIRQLESHLKETLPNNCVCVRLFLNSYGFNFEYETRTAESLKADGVSMKNLRGEFIE